MLFVGRRDLLRADGRAAPVGLPELEFPDQALEPWLRSGWASQLRGQAVPPAFAEPEDRPGQPGGVEALLAWGGTGGALAPPPLRSVRVGRLELAIGQEAPEPGI